MLCGKCRNIHFKRPEEHPLRESNGLGAGIVIYFHHKSMDDLKASADEGCHFCAMLFGGFSGTRRGAISDRYHLPRGEVILKRDVVKKWISEEGGLDEWNTSDWI